MRRYGKWAGIPNGTAEDTLRCIAQVPEDGRSVLFRQCGRKRRDGLNGLCRQHHNMRQKGHMVSVPPEEAA